MTKLEEAYIGIDVAKLRNAVAIAEAGREGGAAAQVTNVRRRGRSITHELASRWRFRGRCRQGARDRAI